MALNDDYGLWGQGAGDYVAGGPSTEKVEQDTALAAIAGASDDDYISLNVIINSTFSLDGLDAWQISAGRDKALQNMRSTLMEEGVLRGFSSSIKKWVAVSNGLLP